MAKHSFFRTQVSWIWIVWIWFRRWIKLSSGIVEGSRRVTSARSASMDSIYCLWIMRRKWQIVLRYWQWIAITKKGWWLVVVVAVETSHFPFLCETWPKNHKRLCWIGSQRTVSLEIRPSRYMWMRSLSKILKRLNRSILRH